MSKPKTGAPKQSKEMFDIRNAGAKELWKQWSVEKEIVDQQEKNNSQQSELDSAYGRINEPLPPAQELRAKEELLSDWEHLRRIARVKFPEGTKISGLSPQNRLVAIAWCLGWSMEKISKASGIANTTVRNWINKRPDVQMFIDQFNLKIGVGDIVKHEFGSMEYSGAQVVKEIMMDKSVSPSTRLDAVKFIYERTRGKPNQNIEMKGSLLKELVSAVKDQEKIEVSDEEEQSLFKSSKSTN